MDWLFLIIGLIAGGAAVWLFQRGRTAQLQAKIDSLKSETERAERRESEIVELREKYQHAQAEKAAIEARMEEKEKYIIEQQKLFDQAKEKLTDAFDSLSKNALEQNSESFVRLAKSTLETIVETAKGEIGKQQESISATVKPLSEALSKYDQQLRDIEVKREGAYAGLTEQIKTITKSEEELRAHTSDLADALRRPEVRGTWGELTLRRCVELAGMSRYCDFDEQVTIDKYRPDLIIYLPGRRKIIVDSKASMKFYIDAQSESDPQRREKLLEKHAKAVKDLMNDLAGKNYQSKFADSADFVIMFIPHEAFYAAALDVDKGLLEDGMKKNVIIASPTILIALLRAIAIGWREEQLKENALKISELGKEIYKRIGIWLKPYVRVGKSLNDATESYNESVKSLQSRLLVTARGFKELGVAGQEDLPQINQIDSLAQTPDLFDEESD